MSRKQCLFLNYLCNLCNPHWIHNLRREILDQFVPPGYLYATCNLWSFERSRMREGELEEERKLLFVRETQMKMEMLKDKNIYTRDQNYASSFPTNNLEKIKWYGINGSLSLATVTEMQVKTVIVIGLEPSNITERGGIKTIRRNRRSRLPFPQKLLLN